MPEEDNGVSMPSKVLNQINEHTAGGFMLFYMGGDGNPEFVFLADNQIIKRGLVSYAKDLLSNLRDFERYEYSEKFEGPNDDDEDDD